MSQNYETCYSTLSNMRAYGQKCYNSFDYFIYFSLSFQHISLFVCNTTLSLSLLSGLHLSVAPYFFLTFIFFISHSLPLFCISVLSSLRLFLSLSLSLSLFFFSLSFFSCHEEKGDSDLKQSSPIEARQFEPLLADLKLCSPKGNRRSLLVVLHSSCRRWLVEFGH